jgi:hypothetical protein
MKRPVVVGEEIERKLHTIEDILKRLVVSYLNSEVNGPQEVLARGPLNSNVGSIDGGEDVQKILFQCCWRPKESCE